MKVRNIHIYLAILILFCGCSDVQFFGPIPNPRFDSQADSKRIAIAIASQDKLARERKIFTDSIVNYENQTGANKCSNYQFGGFDGEGQSIDATSRKVKASAISSCGASYYWMTLREAGDTLVVDNIERRKLQPGDKSWSVNKDSKWQLEVK